ncbi:hypothetical protein ACFQI7_08085 [Paenibacillus allorhizosphaerae]|uniref:Uncharacterized protein n=1 Tax=Paenibacillus allorhizosphaerae TaxID=2849866 RepID=A0ABN7TP48_9BACL|nr:hypothetical protein [Paenibacillus allorhizosphaerae]CAG7638379.1 hypothetical protein PAECIP111802_02434 [Paenibacillus allorhizosphaerae]
MNKIAKALTLTMGGMLLLGHQAFALTPAQEIGSVMGGGNFTNGSVTQQNQFAALQTIGARMARMNVYPQYYYAKGQPTPARLDSVMLQAYQSGVTPMMLFEYYGSYASKGQPLGDYDYWYSVGYAFAERFRPGGAWAQANGIQDWGVTIYTAMNEPDVENLIDKTAYRNALEGLADGVHAVDAALKVNPGGFARANSHSDYSLRGYGPAIADLYNTGKLDGIDLHTYFDVQYSPMDGMYKFSAQSNFDSVKRVSGITADVNFYSTEFNFKKRLVTEEEAAKGFLTAIWDHLGVVKNDGATSATEFAFPWSLFNSAATDTNYGMNTSLSPWTPTARASTLQTVLDKATGMSFVSMDPKGTGEYVLSGGGKKMWVWQNRPYWTNHAGTSYTVTGIPPGAYKLEVIGWDGVRQSIPLAGETSVTISQLAEKETYMFVAYTEASSAEAGGGSGETGAAPTP